MAHAESRQALETVWRATGQVQSSSAQPAHPPPAPVWYYYDPARHQHQSSPLSSSGPSLPLSPPADLDALQTQFTAFRDSLDIIRSDVKDALHQLKTLHTAQNKTVTRLAQLEGVLGVSTGTGRGRQRTNAVPEETIVEQLASIRSAIELLARASHSSSIPLPSTTLLGQDASQSVVALDTPCQSEASSGKQHTQPGLSSSAPESSRSPSSILANQYTVSATHAPVVGTSIRPTAFTAEYLNHFFHDSHCLATETATNGASHHGNNVNQLPLRAVTSSSLPPAVVDAQSRTSNGTTSSSDTDVSVAPSPSLSSSLTRAQVQPSPLQAHSCGTEAVDRLMTLPRMSSSDDSRTLPTPTLCASNLSAGTVVPTSDPGPPDSNSEQSPGSDSGDVHTPCDGGRVANTIEIVIDSEPVVQQSSGPASSLPTPPSMASIDDFEPRVASASTSDSATTKTIVNSRASPLLKLPIIPTPPSLTPELSGGEERLMIPSTCPIGFYSGLPSPLTPTLTPSTVNGMVPLEEMLHALEGARDVAREVEAQKVTEERGDPSGDAEDDATEELAGGTSISTPTSTVHAGTGEPLSRVDSFQISRDAEPPTTPTLSSEQQHPELPQDAPESFSRVDRCARSSSLANIASAPHSRHATPSASSGGLPTQDEDEVWEALMLTASGLSTPAPDDISLPLMSSRQPSRLVSVGPDTSPPLSESTPVNDADHDHGPSPSGLASLAVDPSVLYDLPRGTEPPSSPLASECSLSSLTSIAGSDVVEQDREASRGCPLVTKVRQRGISEITLMSGRARSRALLGGPGASLDELTMLARRVPPKILLKLPKTAPSLKRKRDDMDNKDEGAAGAEVVAVAPASMSRVPPPNITNQLVLTAAPPASHKRTKKHSELGGNATTRKKVHRARTPQSRPLAHHVRNGRIVAVDMFTALESQAQVSATPRMPQSVVRTEGAGEGRRHKRDSQGSRKRAATPPSAKSSPRARSSANKNDAWDSIYQYSGTWPELPCKFEQWDLQFIQCDNCEQWYHYGCVSVKADDPRLSPGIYFGCPECCTQSARRRTARHCENVCKRPDCPEPQVAEDTGVYYVEKLVGRKKVDEDTYLWLAKWDGYPMSECTWIPKENVVGNGTGMFDVFAEDAMEEGVDLSQDVLLLREALDAGFGVED